MFLWKWEGRRAEACRTWAASGGTLSSGQFLGLQRCGTFHQICLCSSDKSQLEWLTYRPNSVDCTREAVVGYGCIPGFNGPHGLAAGKREHQRCNNIITSVQTPAQMWHFRKWWHTGRKGDKRVLLLFLIFTWELRRLLKGWKWFRLRSDCTWTSWEGGGARSRCWQLSSRTESGTPCDPCFPPYNK